MASPQCEDGFTRIANELYEAALRMMTAEEFHVWAAVVRRTYGFGRTEAEVSQADLARMCGCSKRTVRRVLALLIRRQILYIKHNGPKPQVIALEKDYFKWETKSTQIAPPDEPRVARNGHPSTTTGNDCINAGGEPRVARNGHPSTTTGNDCINAGGEPRVARNGHPSTTTGNDCTNETEARKKRVAKYGHSRGSYHYIERKYNKRVSEHFPECQKVAQAYHERIREMHPSLARRFTEKTDHAGAVALDQLVRLDGHPWELVKSVLRWALRDEFWSRNLRSLASCREMGKGGSTKFENCLAQFELHRATAVGKQVQAPAVVSRDLTADELDAVSAGNALGWV